MPSGNFELSKQRDAALALRSAGLLSEALDLLAAPDEFNADLCALRGSIEFGLGRFQEAAVSYSAVALSQPANPDARYNLALSLQRAKRWDAAAEAFESALQFDASWTEAHLGLGACLLEMNRAEDALENFDRACIGFRQGPALFGKAVALQLLGRFDEATEIYERLLAADPHSEALSNCIAMSIEHHDWAQVRERSLRLLQMCPDSVVALRGLVTANLRHGDHQSAANYCSRLLDLAPDCLEAWHNFRIAMEQFQFGAAVPVFAVHPGRKR